MFNIAITPQCGFECDHCLASSGPNRKHPPKQRILDILEFLAGFDEDCDVSFNVVGGEPTRHPAFDEIIWSAARLCDENLRLVTNAEWIFDLEKTYEIIDSLRDAANIMPDYGEFWIVISNDQYHRCFTSEAQLKQAKDIIDEMSCGLKIECSLENYKYDRFVAPLGRGKIIAQNSQRFMEASPCCCCGVNGAEWDEWIEEDGQDEISISFHDTNIDWNGNFSLCEDGGMRYANVFKHTREEIRELHRVAFLWLHLKFIGSMCDYEPQKRHVTSMACFDCQSSWRKEWAKFLKQYKEEREII